MDFKHPFISSTWLVVFYAVFWIIVSFGYFLMLWLSRGYDFSVAAAEVTSTIVVFSVLGSSIWFIIRFSTLEGNSVFKIISSHIIGAFIIISIYLYVSLVVFKLFHNGQGEWIQPEVTTRIMGGFTLYTIYVIFFYAVNYYQGFKEKLRSEGKLMSLVKEAELHALKSQINPHFLFNSLNSISSLTMTDPAKAQEMVINLSQLMRYSLKHNQKEKVLLKQEIENNKLYLGIEKVRFGSKLNPVFHIDKECLNAEIPNMILQPLYENAIKYGVYEAIEPVDIITVCQSRENNLTISILNTYDSNVQSKKGEGIGLRNIRDRLQIIYGNPQLMKIENNRKEFKVTLTIPQKSKKDAEQDTDDHR
jgi:hypothetical protein